MNNQPQVGMNVYNQTDNTVYTIKEQLPEGAYLLTTEDGMEEYYVPEETFSEDVFKPVMEPRQKMAVSEVIDELLPNEEDVDGNLVSKFSEYLMRFYDKKSIDDIFSDFVAKYNITDPSVITKLKSVVFDLGGRTPTITASTVPVIMHIAVDKVPKAIAALLKDDEACSVLLYSRDPGYDLVVIGLKEETENLLQIEGVYIEQMKVQAMPQTGKYSYAEEATRKFGVALTLPDKRLLDFYVDYVGLDGYEAQNLLSDWTTKSGMSFKEFLKKHAYNYLNSKLDKEVELEVEELEIGGLFDDDELLRE